jgi:hypothetical protein
MTNRLSILGLAAAAFAMPLAAQTASDVTEDIRLETRDFARCIAAKDARKAEQLLTMSIGSPDYTRAMKIMLGQSGCVEDPDMATFEPLLLSGALAEMMLKAGVPAGLGARAAAANPGDPALAMADCALRADRTRADALLATTWLSDAERDAAFELQPALKPCLTAEPIKLTPAQLRALVALASLRASAA